MRRQISALTTLALVIILAACGGGGSGSHYSSIDVTVNTLGDNQLTTPQHVTVHLGALSSWKLRVKTVNLTGSSIQIDLAVKQITDPADAKELNTSDGTNVEGYLCSCNGSFTSQLVAGSYYLTIDGQAAPVTIDVLSGTESPTTVKPAT